MTRKEFDVADYQRARTAEQKAERMEAIMDAAESLFRDLPYHEINMGLIAKELGWSRSNLYKYAATQEEVFLSLHERAHRSYIGELVNALDAAPADDAAFARTWAEVTARHPVFLRYQDILIAIIESNASLERLTEFKRSLLEMTGPLIEVLARQLEADPSQMRELYFRLLFQAPNLYSHFHPVGRSAEAMRLAGMPVAVGTFEDAFADFCAMCLTWERQRPIA